MPHASVQAFISRWSGRAAEEAQGNARRLRPEYQNPQRAKQVTPTLDLLETKPAKKAKPKKAGSARKRPWPGTFAARVKSVADALA